MITYNHAEFIHHAIEGILSQDTQYSFELVIGEDLSTDKTRQICESFQGENSKIIKLLPSEANLGMMKNFKRTIKECNGEYLAFCDGDDIWSHKNKLQKQIDFLKKNQNYLGVFSEVDYIDSNNNKIGQSNRMPNTTKSFDFNYLVERNIIHTCSFVVKRQAISEKCIETLEKFPVGDLPLFLLSSLSGQIFGIKEQLASYRIGSGLTVNWNRAQSHQNKLQVLNIINSSVQLSKEQTKHLEFSKIYIYFKLSLSYAKDGDLLKSLKYYFIFIKSTMMFKLLNRHKPIRKINFKDYLKPIWYILLFNAIRNKK